MKARRQLKIQELIAKKNIQTQEELAERLGEEGFDVTQATVSRDIKELGLIKVPTPDDDYRYAVPGETHQFNRNERLKRLLQETVIKVVDSENIVLVRTIPGNAHALASLLDNSNWNEVIGTVAGDDTILLVIKPKEAAEVISKRLTDLMG